MVEVSDVMVLDHLCKSYLKEGRKIKAVEDFSTTLRPGEINAVCGPSGCGKTSLLLLAGGLLSPDSGRVLAEGENISALNANRKAQWRSRYCGFVFQQYHLVPYLTVYENIISPELALGKTAGKRAEAERLCTDLGLNDRKHHFPGELSAGEKQRTALARALYPGPKIILADEITGNLDSRNARLVLDLLAEYRNRGGAVLMVTHDSSAAAEADRIISMEEGRIIHDGE